MYLQLSNEIGVRDKDIIGIFSYETTFCCKDSHDFLTSSDEDGFILNLCHEEKKTVIVTEINKNSKIFLSSVSSNTLIKKIKLNYTKCLEEFN